MPAAWGATAASVGKGAKTFAEMVAASVALTYHQKQQAAAQKEADRLTRSMADRWRDIGRSTKDFAGNIASATTSLLKWAGPLSALTGLLGAGVGLFGLERLAASVSSQRRSATGLGIGYGQQAAFGLNYGRFVDTGSLLSGVSGSLYNATSPGYAGLLGAGISQKFLETHNAADVSVELLHRLPEILKGTPRNLIGARLSALGLDNVIAPEDAVRYLNSPADERSKQEKAYRKDVGGLGLTTDQQRAWQDLQTQLERAGSSIETVFVRSLTPLAPSIGKLSDAVEKAISAFLGSPEVKKAINELADYIGSPALLQDIKTFGHYMEYAAKKLVGVARWLGLIPSADAAAAANDNLSAPSGSRGIYSRALHSRGSSSSAFVVNNNGSVTPLKIPGRSTPSPYGTLDNPWGGTAGGGDLGAATNAMVVGSGIADRISYIKSYAKSIGIDPNVALWVAQHEGLGGKVGDHGTSFGDFQLHYNKQGNAVGDQYTAATGKQASDQSDWQSQDRYALDFARQHGWGSWTSMAGRDPREGIGRVPSDPYQTRQPAPYFNVYNATGGNVNITTSQSASGF